MKSLNEPFWKDEPEMLVKKTDSLMPLFKIFGIIVEAMLLLIPTTILFLLSQTLGFVWLGFIVLLFTYSFFMRRRRKTVLNAAPEVQKRAGEKVGASCIGSAIHVAGYPLLQRDQAVVLALVGEQINIYGYDNAIPLDSISLKNIQAIQTVVYDDERVPHTDVIDSAAQALQVTFLWREQTCICLFRRMRKVRPIDWYHTIQQARLTGNVN